MVLQNQDFLTIELFAREIMSGFITGMHSSPFQGFSVEFAEHRMYNPGDSLRHVDWKLMARTDRMFTKKYEEETNLRCQFIIDISSSMLFPVVHDKPEAILSEPNKLQFSLLTAAIIMKILKKQRDAYGLTLFDSEIIFHKTPTLSVPGHALIMNKMNEYLFFRDKNHASRISKCVEEVGYRIPHRSLIIIFSDTWEEDPEQWNNTLSLLKHKRNEVVFFHIFQKKHEAEMGFDFHPMELQDLESGNKIKIQPKLIQQEYEKHFKKRLEKMKLIFSRFGYDYVEACLEDGYKNVLQTYLQKRKYFN
ncbi:MAG: DUF58 domain-containing protein [Bacteroidia bacterium]|nr:DUF58 domain-containing protein [Bacteroidia bacterium]